jgi:signal transduction histidine kinase
MQRTEAAGELRDLDRSLAAARAVEHRQAEIMRTVAHDLRGNMGIVSNATAALTLDVLPKEQRAELFSMAQRAIAAHTRLLSDLMDLARLQAGHEQRRVQRCNIAQALRELCELTAPVARERGLALDWDGPAELIVEADTTKVGRILQNLLLNSLHYTERGGVSVNWGPADRDGGLRWWLVVADTGPGIRSGAQAVADALEVATQEARRVEDSEVPPPPIRSDSVEPRHGEGIGLSIVKRLAQLLDATIEVESRAGAGTTVRVEFPRRYAATA